jgi:hypothetical protein
VPATVRKISAALLREWLLLLGFALVVLAAVLTVALPELSKEPESDANTRADAAVPAE